MKKSHFHDLWIIILLLSTIIYASLSNSVETNVITDPNDLHPFISGFPEVLYNTHLDSCVAHNPSYSIYISSKDCTLLYYNNNVRFVIVYNKQLSSCTVCLINPYERTLPYAKQVALLNDTLKRLLDGVAITSPIVNIDIVTALNDYTDYLFER